MFAARMLLALATVVGASTTQSFSRQFSNRLMTSSSSSSSCRPIPGDSAWPDPATWSSLNDTVDGRLIAAVPATSVCHDAPFNNYDAEACAEIQGAWDATTLEDLASPAEFFQFYLKNYTCDAFTDRSEPCQLNRYVSYVINVTGAADVQAGIKFARQNNVRLVIKNTGHDYVGKSTGKGGLSLWTYGLSDHEFIPNYNSSYYSGPAIKLGAGTRAFEAYAAVNATGHRMVGGVCSTVGLAGGYSQGGGYGLLNSMYGLGADQVLEWEVVTMDGVHLVATPTQNSDLYWAMSGGGGGNYAVALSMTSRIYKDSVMGGASLTFDDSNVGNDAFWDAVGAWFSLLPKYVDAGNTWGMGLTNTTFSTVAAVMPGASCLDEVDEWMQPFLDDLTSRGIDYEYEPTMFPSYYELYANYLGPLPEGSFPYSPFINSRILPRRLLVEPETNRKVTAALRGQAQPPGWNTMLCVGMNNTRQERPVDNAVLPAWRDALAICLTAGNWDPEGTPEQMAERQRYAVNVLQPALNAATPGGGVYMNEANFEQLDWQQDFYGVNYERLLSIKNQYDPESLLYGRTAVGSEAWYEDGDARLCRVQC